MKKEEIKYKITAEPIFDMVNLNNNDDTVEIGSYKQHVWNEDNKFVNDKEPILFFSISNCDEHYITQMSLEDAKNLRALLDKEIKKAGEEAECVRYHNQLREKQNKD